ncbi:MAG TPA: hypothetical protein DIU07_20855 [Rhodobacteraceae bacterium]|nr:hypothetical protein [Paracoccaceae bacterium]
MKHKRRALMGGGGALGVATALAGFVVGWLAVHDMIVWAFGVWILGVSLVLLVPDPPDKS